MNKLVTIAVSLLWSISAPLAAQDPEPLTPYEKALIESAFDGQLADVQVLVKKGASVKATDASKRTALMWAAFKGHTSVVEYLFGQGAEINAKDSDNMTALIYAAKPAIRIMYGAALMFLTAAFIEGFWSPLTAFPSNVKYAVGAILWILVVTYFTLAGRQHAN